MAVSLSLKEIQSHPYLNGADEAWESWEFTTFTLLHSLGWTTWLEGSLANPGVIAQRDLSPDAEQASSNMYLLLSQRAGGKASSITKLNKDRCGFEVWRLFHREYLPEGAEPHHAMLEAIIQPKWWAAQEHRSRVFTDVLYDWESLIGQYSRQSSDSVSDSVKCATVLGYAPRDIVGHLRGPRPVCDACFQR